MIMKKALCISLLLCFAAAALPPASAATLAGQSFDDSLRLSNRELKLNGLGVRGIFFFKAYVAALYLGDKASTGREVLLNQGPKRLQLRMLMNIGSDDVKKALVDGMRKNVSEAQWSAMQDRVQAFAATIDSIGVTRSGDTINLDYLPDRGMTLAVNDVAKGSAISGQDFYNAMLEIFVGDDPVDTRLRNGLLGQ
jgi:hypothetical protein